MGWIASYAPWQSQYLRTSSQPHRCSFTAEIRLRPSYTFNPRNHLHEVDKESAVKKLDP